MFAKQHNVPAMFAFKNNMRTICKRSYSWQLVPCFAYVFVLNLVYLYLFLKLDLECSFSQKQAKILLRPPLLFSFPPLPFKKINAPSLFSNSEHSNIPFKSKSYFRTLPEQYTFTQDIAYTHTFQHRLTNTDRCVILCTYVMGIRL